MVRPTTQQLLHRLDAVQRFAEGGKLRRLLKNPAKYLFATLYARRRYAHSSQGILRETTLFFGQPMQVSLPSSTDLYLAGGKTHPSEVRLARFMIRQLKTGDAYLDIGAHFGYFSLLAAQLVGTSGLVRAYEPSTEAFSILAQNAERSGGAVITAVRSAVSDKVGEETFYEFPAKYSEYNTLERGQYVGEAWLTDGVARPVSIPTTTVDALTDKGFHPAFIKIDVEGAEHRVLVGARGYLAAQKPMVVMEYLAAKGENESPHRQAAEMLRHLGYAAHLISDGGDLQPVTDLAAYLSATGIDSENIVFRFSGEIGAPII